MTLPNSFKRCCLQFRQNSNRRYISSDGITFSEVEIIDTWHESGYNQILQHSSQSGTTEYRHLRVFICKGNVTVYIPTSSAHKHYLISCIGELRIQTQIGGHVKMNTEMNLRFHKRQQISGTDERLLASQNDSALWRQNMYMGRACAITSYEVQAKQSIICSITVQAILLTFSCRLMSPVSLYLVRTVILKYRPLGCSGINFGKINGFFQLTTHIHVSLSQM